MTALLHPAKFHPGRCTGTPAAIRAIADAGQEPSDFIDRHVQGDWGEDCAGDGRLNDGSLIDGSRIISAYRTLLGERIWIITDAADENGHRPLTTVLLPTEY